MATSPESKRRKCEDRDIEAGISALRDALEKRGDILRSAEQLEKKLTVWNTICGQLLEKKNALIQEVNDHATNLPKQDEVMERYEYEIKEWQDERRAEMEQEFDVLQTSGKAEKALKMVADIVQKEREIPAVIHAKELLETAEHDESFPEQFPAQLTRAESDLKITPSWKKLVEDNVTQADASFNIEQCYDQLYSLDHVEFKFVDLEPELDREHPNFGEFRREWATKPKEIFKIKLPVTDSATMYIPCVVNLGKLVAVARPTKEGEEEESGYIDIYKFEEGKTQRVHDEIDVSDDDDKADYDDDDIDDDDDDADGDERTSDYDIPVLTMEFVPPILDMCATPEGHLAILGGHDGGGSDFGITVTSIDPEKNDAETFCSFPLNVEKPISLSLTLFHEFVVLCQTSGRTEQDEAQKQIIVLDKDGVVRHIHVVPEDECYEAGYITCGGKFIFLKPGSNDNPIDDVCIYEIQSSGIKLVKKLTDILAGSEKPSFPSFLSFSATLWGDFYIASIYGDDLFLSKCVKAKGEALEWTLPGHKDALHKVTLNPLLPVERKVCISARDGYIILSSGQTIRRYRQYLTS